MLCGAAGGPARGEHLPCAGGTWSGRRALSGWRGARVPGSPGGAAGDDRPPRPALAHRLPGCAVPRSARPKAVLGIPCPSPAAAAGPGGGSDSRAAQSVQANEQVNLAQEITSWCTYRFPFVRHSWVKAAVETNLCLKECRSSCQLHARAQSMADPQPQRLPIPEDLPLLSQVQV